MGDLENSSEPTGKSDEQLMSAYVDGDSGAFRQLFARYAPLLARIVRMQVSSDDESRDLVGEKRRA